MGVYASGTVGSTNPLLRRSDMTPTISKPWILDRSRSLLEDIDPHLLAHRVRAVHQLRDERLVHPPLPCACQTLLGVRDGAAA